MEKKDARIAKSGISEELSKEIVAQHAIINSAVELISQLPLEPENESLLNKPSGEWVYSYSMKDLAYWLHHYTARRHLRCPKCKADTTFTCEICKEVYEYHDEL